MIFFTLNKEEFPLLLSVYRSLDSFPDSAKSRVRAFPISQPNIHNCGTTKIQIPVKIKMEEPTHNISKVFFIVYLCNANRALRKPCSFATCNLTHKGANIA